MLVLSHHCHQPPLSSFRALKPHRCSSFLPKLHFFSRLQRFSVELQIAHGCFPLPRSSNLLFQFHPRVSIGEAGKCADRELGDENSDLADLEDLGDDSKVFKKTLQLVECAMFASVAGLAYFLSNSLAVENYFSCFFSLPIVISSIRWGIAAGRKTMVATVMLLFTLSGPVKASTYLLLHGLVGLAMGTLWRLRFNWSTSILLCTLIRAMGAVGYVLLSSFLIRENILALITINIHASLTFIFTAMGINIIPSMNAIYLIFGSLLLLNCGFFVFLLHILYSIFLSKLGLKDSLTLPSWMAKAI
ncbi:uncharacterized protein LOC122042180 [Zingiber officinale]|uniref:Uncharacterized protein n=1 Tax=Zingiber officinale TaxID=94328 RepID=A0A8J5HXQ4_ZINOF|nr:uncharacterized protein LOC122042180 [Zingiber officinale]XP_042458103.1 uncharacterized protein LOC122042180 [Zingiber officinale]KAG6529107.1 hypothetical protein ZIOFF_011301 [Zingiber officinale]